MILPDNLTLPELIGALKAQAQTFLSTASGSENSEQYFEICSRINQLESVKQYIDDRLKELRDELRNSTF